MSYCEFLAPLDIGRFVAEDYIAFLSVMVGNRYCYPFTIGRP